MLVSNECRTVQSVARKQHAKRCSASSVVDVKCSKIGKKVDGVRMPSRGVAKNVCVVRMSSRAVAKRTFVY